MSRTKSSLTRRRRVKIDWRDGTAALGVSSGDTMAIVGQIKAGFDVGCFVKFEKLSGLTREKIAQCAGIPIRTLTRRKGHGRFQPNESDRILRVARVFGIAVELFEGDVASAREWLLSPQVGLGGAIPLEVASNDVGAREVENLIGRLEHGVFS